MLSLPTLFLGVTSLSSVLAASSPSSASTHAHSHAHATPTGASNAASTSSLAPAAPAASSQAVDRSSEQGEAQIKDPFQECSYYSYPPVTEIVSHSTSLHLFQAESATFRQLKADFSNFFAYLPSSPLAPLFVLPRTLRPINQLPSYPDIWVTADLSNAFVTSFCIVQHSLRTIPLTLFLFSFNLLPPSSTSR